MTHATTNLWSEKELNVLREIYPNGSWPEILDRLYGRSKLAILNMASLQGIRKNHFRKYIPHKKMLPLVQRRKTAGLSQIEVGEISGYGLSVISRLESGKTKPNEFHLRDYNDTLERFGA